jgi:sulfoxide reductase heme-binding subunit YedZ
MNDSALWYTARGAGTTLLILLTLAVVLGIAARSGRPAAGLPGFALAAVHRNASLLAVVLLVVHVTTLVLDPFAHVGALDPVIPFGAGYQPLWVGLGTCAADVLLALVVTSLLRHRIGARVWRGVHWAAYAAWPFAFAHALGAGTDVGTGWLRLVLAVCAAAVALAVGWRCSASFLTAGRRLPAGPPGSGPPPPPAHHPIRPDRPAQAFKTSGPATGPGGDRTR